MPVDVFGRSATATSFEAASLISLIGTKVSRSGDNLSGDLSLDGHRLKQIPHEPTDTTDGAAASFVIAGDIAVKDAAVLRSGVQTMTGNLELDSHYIKNVVDPANQQDAATKSYVDNQNGLRVLKTGDTMTGDLDMSGKLVRGLPTVYPPTPPMYTGNEVVSWDQAVALAQDTVKNLVDPVLPQNAATKNYVDLRDNMRLFVGGGTIMGDIQMTDHHITGLADPSENQDAATKWYVDTHASMRSAADSVATPVCGPAIFRQQLLEVGELLAKIPLSVVGAAASGIILADPTTIHITTGGLYRFEVCGCCVATATPAPGVCSEGLIRVGTHTHTICWTPVGRYEELCGSPGQHEAVRWRWDNNG